MIALLVMLAAAVPPHAPGAALHPASAHSGPSTAADTAVTTLPEVRIEGERPPAPHLRLPTAFASEIRLDLAPHALSSVSEVLTRAAGVHVRQLGGLGAFTTVSLRDAAPGQVAVLLDGVPLGSAASGVVDLSTLPATAIDRVEVYRGLAPLALGVASPGGAINIVTRAAAEPRLALARGSFGTWEARGGGGIHRGALAAGVSGGWQRSRGDYAYLDDRGTWLNPADDLVRPRGNDRVEIGSGLASATWDLGSARVRGDQSLVRKTQGLPGAGNVPARGASLDVERAITRLVLERGSSPAAPGMTLEGSLTREQTHFVDRLLPDRGELGGTRHDALTHVGVGRARGELRSAVGPVAVSAEGDLRRERQRRGDPLDGTPDPAPAIRTAGGLTGTLRTVVARRLTVHAARRWERLVDRRDPVGGVAPSAVAREVATPQLGAALALGAGFELRGNWTDAARAPEFEELFGNQATEIGNPALRPERLVTRDGGIVWQAGRGAWRGQLEAASFVTQARDLIFWWRNGPNTVRADNLADTRITGTEVAAHVEAPRGFGLGGSATWARAVNRSPFPRAWSGRELPLRPHSTSWLGASWSGRGWRTTLDVDHAGATWLDPANRARLPARTLVGAVLERALAGGAFALTLQVRNLGDVRAYDVGGFPLPGRTLSIACEFRRPATSTGRP